MLYFLIYNILFCYTISVYASSCDSLSYLPNEHLPTKCIEIPDCETDSATLTDFEYIENKENAKEETIVSICHSKSFLYFEFENKADPLIVQSNKYHFLNI